MHQIDVKVCVSLIVNTELHWRQHQSCICWIFLAFVANTTCRRRCFFWFCSFEHIYRFLSYLYWQLSVFSYIIHRTHRTSCTRGWLPQESPEVRKLTEKARGRQKCGASCAANIGNQSLTRLNESFLTTRSFGKILFSTFVLKPPGFMINLGLKVLNLYHLFISNLVHSVPCVWPFSTHVLKATCTKRSRDPGSFLMDVACTSGSSAWASRWTRIRGRWK